MSKYIHINVKKYLSSNIIIFGIFYFWGHFVECEVIVNVCKSYLPTPEHTVVCSEVSQQAGDETPEEEYI